MEHPSKWARHGGSALALILAMIVMAACGASKDASAPTHATTVPGATAQQSDATAASPVPGAGPNNPPVAKPCTLLSAGALASLLGKDADQTNTAADNGDNLPGSSDVQCAFSAGSTTNPDTAKAGYIRIVCGSAYSTTFWDTQLKQYAGAVSQLPQPPGAVQYASNGVMAKKNGCVIMIQLSATANSGALPTALSEAYQNFKG